MNGGDCVHERRRVFCVVRARSLQGESVCCECFILFIFFPVTTIGRAHELMWERHAKKKARVQVAPYHWTRLCGVVWCGVVCAGFFFFFF